MRYYLLATSAAGAENLPEKYRNIAHSEECFYTRCVPEEYIDNPPEDWPQDTAEKLRGATDIVRNKATNFWGEEVDWIRFDYKGERFFIESPDLENLVKLSGGMVNVYGRHMKNSTRFFEDEECEAFLGAPDIGENMVIEFVDEGLENELHDLGKFD